MKQFKASKWSNAITSVEVIRESDKNIWFEVLIRGKKILTRELKKTKEYQYFLNKSEAYNWKLKALNEKLSSANYAVKSAKEEIEIFIKNNNLYNETV